MDNINSQIGQNIARDAASVLTEKSFTSNNLIGTASGASQFAKSDNPVVMQQVRNLDKTASSNAENTRTDEQKKLKNTGLTADTNKGEESLNFAATLDSINSFMQSASTALSFSVDDATDRQVVTVKDRQSGEVIRQIPSEEVLNFAERIKELESEVSKPIGVLIDRQA
uniref:flagellar protein FlaG n=1 Tax=Ningiella ruwaisensis TaxID=2364274 RepID=UPI001F4FC7A2|nr:flagellar protein FlaG [Ningiella ruwaisensis]